MKYNPPQFTKLEDMAFIDVCRLTEEQALSILEDIRWPDGPVCPHCGSVRVTRLKSDCQKVRDGLIQCNDCRKQFTVMVGTIMHRSHITYRQWIQAFHSMCSHKKGVSALQLQRNLGLHSYQSAWHLGHRIRLAMQKDPLLSQLKGIVEVDETYIGGKAHGKRGRGAANKTIIQALVERGGKVKAKPVKTISTKELQTAIRKNVSNNSTIITDELPSYNGIGKTFIGGHKTFDHSKGQYAKGKYRQIHVNSAESYFALLKRGIHGTFHHVSPTHLDQYCDEFSFRWNHREITDGERTVETIKVIEGKRLMYWDSCK